MSTGTHRSKIPAPIQQTAEAHAIPTSAIDISVYMFPSMQDLRHKENITSEHLRKNLRAVKKGYDASPRAVGLGSRQ